LGVVFEVFEGPVPGGLPKIGARRGGSNLGKHPTGGAIKNMKKGQEQTKTAALQRCPEYRDPWALIEHGIAGMVRLSRCRNPAVALEACRWLARYAESLLKSERQGKAGGASGVSPGGSPPWRV
jgi:hypothetical protein